MWVPFTNRDTTNSNHWAEIPAAIWDWERMANTNSKDQSLFYFKEDNSSAKRVGKWVVGSDFEKLG